MRKRSERSRLWFAWLHIVVGRPWVARFIVRRSTIIVPFTPLRLTIHHFADHRVVGELANRYLKLGGQKAAVGWPISHVTKCQAFAAFGEHWTLLGTIERGDSSAVAKLMDQCLFDMEHELDVRDQAVRKEERLSHLSLATS